MTATTQTFLGTDIEYSFSEGAEEMNAGKYQVTDPCYFLGHDEQFWNDFCQFMFPEHNKERADSYTIEIAGYKVFAWGTAYGDGCYPTLNNGYEVGSSGVDAGMLALVPVELYELLKDTLKGNDDTSAPFVEMTRSFTPEVDEGDCSFGSYEVLTSDKVHFCRHCGERGDLNWNDLCNYCQREEDEEEECRLEEEEER